jgi:hypothetical protein
VKGYIIAALLICTLPSVAQVQRCSSYSGGTINVVLNDPQSCTEILQLFDGLPLFGRAADAGYPPGKAAIGLCFQNGIGVLRDPVRADSWLRRSRAYVALASATLGLSSESQPD